MLARPQKIIPVRDQLLIQLMATEKKTEGGLHIPGAAQEQRPIGHVVDKGPDCDIVDIGEAILFRGAYVLSQVEAWPDGVKTDYFLCSEEDVVAIVVISGVKEPSAIVDE